MIFKPLRFVQFRKPIDEICIGCLVWKNTLTKTLLPGFRIYRIFLMTEVSSLLILYLYLSEFDNLFEPKSLRCKEDAHTAFKYFLTFKPLEFYRKCIK